MPVDKEEKTVDIDTSGPGADIEIAEEKVTPVEQEETNAKTDSKDDNQSADTLEKSDVKPDVQDSEQKTEVPAGEKAEEKVRDLHLENVTLSVMNAQEMKFPDNSFDCVTACYVVSAAPDPQKVVSEICRVCKPNGRIVFINHFKSQNFLLAKFEELINGACKKIGWETTLDLDPLLKSNNLSLIAQERVNVFNYWKAVLCLNSKKK